MALLDFQFNPPEILPMLGGDALAVIDRAKLAEALEILPSDHRLLLAMLYVEGCTLSETALVLDMTVSDVLTRHAVAMNLVREVLSQKPV